MYNISKIYIFGNPLLDFDNLPIKLASELRLAFPEIDFVHHDPNENLHPDNGRLVIIDTVEAIDKIILIDDIDQLQTISSCSLHDFDLAFNLKLLRKIGELNSLLIFGIPMNGDINRIKTDLIHQIQLTLKKCEAQDIQGS